MNCSYCVALQGFVRILSFDKPVRHLMLGCQLVEWLQFAAIKDILAYFMLFVLKPLS